MSLKEQFLAPLMAHFKDLAPILVLAPTTRCGSTLLQRAINLAEDAIIYGENFLFMEGVPRTLCGGALRDLVRNARVVKATQDAFLAGDKGMDGSALFPDYVAYRRQLVAGFYGLARFYREQAARAGYQRWGLKHQIRNLEGFRYFVDYIPDFRAVTIYRDVVAVARSIATRWPDQARTAEHCAVIGRRWRDNLQFLLTLDPPRNLVLRYEDLIAAPETYVPAIATHLGVRLSRDAFAKQVNVHGFDADAGKPLEGYVSPRPLAEAKRQAVVEAAAPLYAQLGYSREVAA